MSSIIKQFDIRWNRDRYKGKFVLLRMSLMVSEIHGVCQNESKYL